MERKVELARVCAAVEKRGSVDDVAVVASVT
ncbi:hypothetical protein A2U01_0071851, partial [Trifolium medium]|nr:hypothetical protein [Trifolium medium]